MQFRIDTATRRMHWGTISVLLTHSQLRMVTILASAPERVVPRSRLWHWVSEAAGPKVIDVHLSHIRRLCQAAGMPNPIETLWGSGLRWNAPVEIDRSGEAVLVPPEYVRRLRRVLSDPRHAQLHYAIFG